MAGVITLLKMLVPPEQASRLTYWLVGAVGYESAATQLSTSLPAAPLPATVATEAKREVSRLRLLSSASSEYQVLRNYLEWVLALPWGRTGGTSDIALDRVEEALDHRHWGLREAKDRYDDYADKPDTALDKAAETLRYNAALTSYILTGLPVFFERIAASAT